MPERLSRRQMFARSGVVAGVTGATLLGAAGEKATAADDPKKGIRYCLNTSTIRGKDLPLGEVVDIAAKAGYQAVEPWIREIEAYQKAGGSLRDLKNRIADHGLTVESAIGFAGWAVDDAEQRAAGLEQAKLDMDLVRKIGGTRIAAPPAGAHRKPGLDLREAGRRYRALLELGDAMGVVPQVEFWGPAQSLSRLSEAVFVAVESGHAKACLLPDVYHLFRGGSDFASLRLVAGTAIHVFHANDYPGDVPRLEQNDSHRVYPGDGVAPLGAMLRTLWNNGFRGALSLELFNPEYWKQDPLAVARTGLEKMRESVEKSLG